MMPARIRSYGAIRQIAWLTDDLDSAIAQWCALAGIGPWTVYRNVRLDGEYRGTAATIQIDVGLAYQDEMQIELIAPRGTGPSPYHDAMGKVRTGMHHIAWLVPDVASATEAATATGLELVFRAEGGNGATRVAYLEAPEDPSMLLELIEATSPIRDGFDTGIAAARAWDGSNPVTIIDFGA